MGKRTVAGAVLLSMALLVPCYWQPRIEAGDLSSHIYNAWLAQLIENGQAPGLALVRQTNNVLFDWMLDGMMRAFGAAVAQHAAVSFSVLVFFWGAFAFIASSARPQRAPWEFVPCLGMLAYGWVFRMGLFNFYLSLGLSFGALALARQNKCGAWTASVLLCAVAFVAHPLPVIWAVGLLAYERAAQSLAPRRRFSLMLGALVALAVAGFWLNSSFPTRREVAQLAAIMGVDQLWIYGRNYVAVAGALLAFWFYGFLCVRARRGLRRTLLDVRFHLWALTTLSLVLLPTGAVLPGYRSGLDFVAERMSLAGAVLFCGLLAAWRMPKGVVAATGVLAVVFFALSYTDERALNRLEARMEQLVAPLPPGQRLVSELADPEIRIPAAVHLIDRVCVGRCFSYANYEPSTWQFRVRVLRPGPIVVSNYADSWQIQNGGYRVRDGDLPMYKIDVCGPHKAGLCLFTLEAGDTLRNSSFHLGRDPSLLESLPKRL